MTLRQKQCLLAYFGHYQGLIDGIWGSKSQAATVAFQQSSGLEADGIFGPATEAKILQMLTEPQDDWWPEIRYFKRTEFACKCGTFCDGYPAEMQRGLVALAEDIREHFGAPAHVISGLRCRTHNTNVGGASQSRHMTGRAVDLQVQGVSADALLAYVQTKPAVRYAYKINETNVHFDIL